MKLFKVINKARIGWDDYREMIVAAYNAEHALHLANELAEDTRNWQPKVKEIIIDNLEAGVICSDFNQG